MQTKQLNHCQPLSQPWIPSHQQLIINHIIGPHSLTFITDHHPPSSQFISPVPVCGPGFPDTASRSKWFVGSSWEIDAAWWWWWWMTDGGGCWRLMMLDVVTGYRPQTSLLGVLPLVISAIPTVHSLGIPPSTTPLNQRQPNTAFWRQNLEKHPAKLSVLEFDFCGWGAYLVSTSATMVVAHSSTESPWFWKRMIEPLCFVTAVQVRQSSKYALVICKTTCMCVCGAFYNNC